ncbi:MAG: hypothetical protein ACE5EB_08585 [Thermodesulfobacteriota bacterium]
MKRILLTIFLILTATLFIKADMASSATGTQGVAGDVSAYTAGLAANGIVFSRHNLGAFGRVLHTASRTYVFGCCLPGDPGFTILTMGEGTTQVCVFCHTPHHSETGNNNPPLWNRVNTPTSYTAYGSTIGGSTINDADITGSSLACLSCHDGVTTFDTLVNAPGAGGVVPGGADHSWFWGMPQVTFPPPQQSRDHFATDLSSGGCVLCHNSNFIERLVIGTDLTNDHPVSVPYSGSTKASLRPKNTLLSAIDLTTGLSNTNALSAYYQAMTQNRWAVKGSISDTAHISDLLRNDKVECSSCHDPHFRNLSWDEVDPTYNVPRTNAPKTWCTSGEDCSDGMFLRRVGGNTGSGVCRTCHDK